MKSTTARFALASALALPFGLAIPAGHAADLVETAAKMEQLSTFSDAVKAAGLEDKLAGEGPFTIFAPTNQAFEQLPQPILSKLLEEAHQAELADLVESHVVAGKTIAAGDLGGRQTTVDTAAGDQLTVEGGGSAVLVIPAGMTAAGAGQPDAERTEVAESSDMPATEHQQEVLETEVGEETRQTAAEGEMPATEHQEEVLAEGERSAAADSASELARQARVVEADVTADNGVIHVIDAVLVSQALSKTLEQLKGGGA